MEKKVKLIKKFNRAEKNVKLTKKSQVDKKVKLTKKSQVDKKKSS